MVQNEINQRNDKSEARLEAKRKQEKQQVYKSIKDYKKHIKEIK